MYNIRKKISYVIMCNNVKSQKVILYLSILVVSCLENMRLKIVAFFSFQFPSKKHLIFILHFF